MPDVKINIGGREFEVACQAGEEHYLISAATLLDQEASGLVNQIGRMPEGRMLLMSGLMLADKAAGHQDQLNALQRKIDDLESEISNLRDTAPEARTVEVPVVPQNVVDTLAELAARAEALADAADEATSA